MIHDYDQKEFLFVKSGSKKPFLEYLKLEYFQNH